MNSKDLLSINEAFAKASSKVTADEPAKKDEVVTESVEPTKDVAEDHGYDDLADDEEYLIEDIKNIFKRYGLNVKLKHGTNYDFE